MEILARMMGMSGRGMFRGRGGRGFPPFMRGGRGGGDRGRGAMRGRGGAGASGEAGGGENPGAGDGAANN